MSKGYNLSEKELRDIAAVCFREQGRTKAGIQACASQMCNYHEHYWANKYDSPYQTVIESGWYGRNVQNAFCPGIAGQREGSVPVFSTNEAGILSVIPGRIPRGIRRADRAGICGCF